MIKEDEENPNYRSRMVGEEFNDRVLEVLFGATPPFRSAAPGTQLGGDRD